MSFPRGETAIVGVATHGEGESPGFTSLDLAAQASLQALAMAGLRPNQVDAVFVGLPDEFLSGLSLSEYLGIQPCLTNNNRTGGSAFLTHLAHASLALAAGECEVALIAYGSNQRTGAGKLVRSSKPPTYEGPYRPLAPASSYALVAARYMHEYGATRRDLAEVAVAARRWAQLNPAAYMRDPLTIEDVLSARMVSDPLSVRDCCLVSDGAAAVVLTRADRARDITSTPAYVLAAAEAVGHRDISSMPNLTTTCAVESGARAYAQAGVGPGDVDVVALYDAFTINTILFLEDLGFCRKGEGAGFVRDGAIAPGGRLAVNTNGGGLSYCHPGMYGLFTIVEAARQVMGLADLRQIAGTEIALAHGNGGVLASQATAILGAASTV